MAVERLPDQSVWTKAMACVPYRPGMESELTIKTRFGDIVELGQRDGDYMLVPRGLVSGYGEDLRSEGDKVDFEVLLGPKNTLQEKMLARTVGLLSEDCSHILQAGTGTGKSFIALAAAAEIGRRTLVVVTKDRMMAQWKGEIEKFLGIPAEEVGHIQQKKCTCLGKSISVGMLHSLATGKYPPWVYDYFGLVVFDEIHRLGAEYFGRISGMFSSKLRLGLSATPKRSDGREFVFVSHIGPVRTIADKTMMKPKVITSHTSFTLPLVTRKTPDGYEMVPFPVKPGKLGKVNLFLARDQQRNAKILNFVKQAYDKGRNIVVFTALVDKHIRPLRSMLVEAGVPAEDIGMFARSAVKLSVLDEQKYKRVVLTTFGQCSEAIDVPQWDTAVLALPMANVKQIVGRVLREHEGKKQPVVFDLVDGNVPVLQDYYVKRVSIYKSLGATLV